MSKIFTRISEFFRNDHRAYILPLVLLAAVAFLVFRPREDLTEVAARHLSSRLSHRMEVLVSYMDKAIATPRGGWPEMKELPEDMTIYRYFGDSLDSWNHQFPLDNDELNTSQVFANMASLRPNITSSPLSEVDTTIRFMSFGPKWYLVKAISDGAGSKVIGGLEVKNSSDGTTVNGVNRRLKLPDVFSLYPLHYGDGAEVKIGGRPLMKLIREGSPSAPILPESGIIWFIVALLLSVNFGVLYTHKNIRHLSISIAAIAVVTGGMYFLGRLISSAWIFSPLVYADGSVFYSLGAVLIINLAISLVFLSLYICRLPLVRYFRNRGAKIYAALAGAVCLTLALLVLYISTSLKSIIVNSNISLELFKIGEVSWYTVYIYLSYIFLFSTSVLLLVFLRPWLKDRFSLNINFLSKTSRFAAAVFCAICFVSLTAVKGLEREERQIQVWANRLALDRNLAFELQILIVENAIANDAFISSVAMEKRDYSILLNRITENYLGRMSQDYDIGVYIYREKEANPELMKFFTDRLAVGTPISPGSRFVYTRSALGRSQYTGRFLYYNAASGLTNLFLTIESKSEKDDIGYSAVLGSSAPGSIVLPHQYSFARYLNGKLINYKGNYAYPTVMEGRFEDHIGGDIQSGGYEHFIRAVSGDEVIVISRQSFDFTSYLLAGFMVALAVLFFLGIFSVDRARRSAFANNYFRSTINTVLYFSLLGTLVVMALVSVLFVYRRNEANVMNLMTSKIGTIQSIVQAGCRFYSSYEDFDSQAAGQMLSEIADYTKSDITLYTTKGKVFKTTRPEVFERMIWGRRADEDAYRSIMYENKRFFIHKEKVFGRSYYAMYAPVFNGEGKTLAILCSPYTDTGLEFRTEAVFHTLFIVTIFFILLLLARSITERIVNRMFSPLIEMGRKMISARSEGLEYIIYEREDEISALVRAYNLMVRDLSESSKQVAQAERDKAWSEMARQVAHEIKNPLTPIKLQIQRIIRLREKGDASWPQKFEDMAPLILESIDSLTDTANEFSTFAKLYSEEPVTIDLDKLIADQVSLFDGRSGVKLQYIGLKGAKIVGPKPQLTRVIVNLLTNAFQAVENQPQEGQVMVSLRNSSREGYYDVVIEDNGPGVKDENRARLFTPNFTTKSGGTGLGLAICKNILERCGGEISYSKSFTLGGACFTFRLPKA